LTYVKNKISRAIYGIKQVRNSYQKIVWKRTTIYLLWYTNLGECQFINPSENCLQKRSIRIINNADYNNHTDLLFKNCQIFKLSDMYQYQVCLFMDDFISKRLKFLNPSMAYSV
jgi:hypothetical protein